MTSPRPHPLTRLFYCVLGLVFASILMGGMLYVGSALATVWTGRPPGQQLQEIVAEFEIPLLLLSYPAQVVWISYCRTHLDGFSFGSLGLRFRRVFSNLARGAATGALAITLLFSILWLSGLFSVTGWSVPITDEGFTRATLGLVGYAAAFLAIAFYEEVVFRGYVLHNLNNWLGWKGAVFVQGVLFAVLHLLNVFNESSAFQAAAVGALPALLLIAVFFSLSYRKTGSLWFPIGFHFAWNFFLGPVFSLPVSGVKTFGLLEVTANESNWLTGGPFGAEGSVLLIPILVALIYFISLAPDHPQAVLDLELLGQEELPLIAPETAMAESEEIERENRFQTKFGTSQGFSAETLRELRDLQEERERKLRETQEAQKREALATSSFAPPPSKPQPEVEAAPVPVTATVSIPAPAPQPLPVAPVTPKPIPAAPAPVTAAPPTPEPSSAPSPSPAPSSPAPAVPPAKKKQSPRW